MMPDSKKNKSNIFERYILPGIILQSVLLGGGYATGREIVTYGAKFGALGYIAGLGIFIGFTIMCIMTFAIARIFKAYDYKTLVKQFSGKFYILFDALYILFGILAISVMASASGEIGKSILHIPYYLGVGAMVIFAGILNFYGGRLIEKISTIETIVVYISYIIFSIFAITHNPGNIHNVFLSGNTSFIKGPVSPFTALNSGIIYVGFNTIVLSSALFTVKRQTKPRETIISGLISGALMCIPWFLTYFSVISFYPSKEVMNAPIPWLVMLRKCAPSWVIPLFAIVIIWALLSAATGLIFALMERLKVGLSDVGSKNLTPKKRAIIASLILIISATLSKFGIINLIAKGYTVLSYGFIVVYVIPILTIGLYRIFHPGWKKEFWSNI